MSYLYQDRGRHFVSDLYLQYNVRFFSSPLLIAVYCILGALAVKNTPLHSSGVLTRILERILNAHCNEQVNSSQQVSSNYSVSAPLG